MASRRRFSAAEALQLVLSDRVDDDLAQIEAELSDDEDDGMCDTSVSGFGCDLEQLVPEQQVPEQAEVGDNSSVRDSDTDRRPTVRPTQAGDSDAEAVAAPSTGFAHGFDDFEFEDISAADWEHSAAGQTGFIDQFTKASGPKIDVPDDHFEENFDPLYVFEQLFTPELCDYIVQQTNLYAEQVITQNPEKHKMKWTPLASPELQVFLGVLIMMGIDQLPRLSMYWEQSTHLRHPGISEFISRDRFLQIWRYLHLADNSKMPERGSPNFDKIYKIRPFINLLLPKFIDAFQPGCQLSADEGMVPFRGRVSFRQYMKDKPIKWGIKLWVLCDAATGYIIRIIVYIGKDTQDPEASQGLTTRVILKLVEGFEGSFHHIYMDNFYTSIPLFLKLRELGIYACGTIRKNRVGVPREIVLQKGEEKDTERGDYYWLTNGPLLITRWYDNRAVYHLSTIHEPLPSEGELELAQRRLQDGALLQVSCPPTVLDYNQYMGGVDRSDQAIAKYSMMRKSYKWWRKVFWHLLEASILNAYILYTGIRSQRHLLMEDYLSFRMSLAQLLVAGRCLRKQAGRPMAQSELRLENVGLHLPEYSEKQHDCRVCNRIAKENGVSYDKGRRRVHQVCNGPGCHGVGLCGPTATANHFADYHYKLIYWK